MSRSVCQPDAPTIRADSSCDGGTACNADEYNIIENAVPRHVLKTTRQAIG